MLSAFLPSAGCVNKVSREQKNGSNHYRRAGGAQKLDRGRASAPRGKPLPASPPSCRLDSRARRPSLSLPFFPLLSSSFSLILVRNTHMKVGSGIRTYPRPARATAIGYATASLQSPLLHVSEPPSLTRNCHRIIFLHECSQLTKSNT